MEDRTYLVFSSDTYMLLTWHYPGPGRDLPEWGHLPDPLLLQAADLGLLTIFEVLSLSLSLGLGLGEHGGDRDPAAGGGELVAWGRYIYKKFKRMFAKTLMTLMTIRS